MAGNPPMPGAFGPILDANVGLDMPVIGAAPEGDANPLGLPACPGAAPACAEYGVNDGVVAALAFPAPLLGPYQPVASARCFCSRRARVLSLLSIRWMRSAFSNSSRAVN